MQIDFKRWFSIQWNMCVYVYIFIWSLSHFRLHSVPWTVAVRLLCPGFLEARMLRWVVISSSRRFSLDPTRVFCVSCIGTWILTTEPPGGPYNGILLSNQKEWTAYIYSSMGESLQHYTKWNKSYIRL